MAEHMQEEEDLEALRRWWEENGKVIVAAICLAIFGTVGWQKYEGYSASQEEAASDLFMKIVVAKSEERETQDVSAIAQQLRLEHPGSQYAKFGALIEASVMVERDELANAETSLRWALARGNTQSDMGQLIQLRLARVLASNGEESKAFEILNQESKAYPVAYAQAKGDIHLAAGRIAQALEAYRVAALAATQLRQFTGMLDTKIQALETRQDGHNGIAEIEGYAG